MRLPLVRSWSFLGLGLASLALLVTAGCHGFRDQRTQRSSSVVAFLYPKETNPLPRMELPVLRLPLRVGVAFVPSGGGGDISELQKSTLLQRVAAEFKAREYIEHIEIVPSSYLRAGGGFENLDQVRRLLNVDVVALVAFDQEQFTDQNFLSLAYWTIVGAYIFKGDKNDTQTLMEAAVYDVASRKLLFRAPGANELKGTAAAVYIDEKRREDSGKSLQAATDDLVKNLKTQLEDFRTRVKEAPGTLARVEHKPGYSGGGSFDGAFAAALVLLAGAQRWRRRS